MQMSVQELAQLGMRQIAYLRSVWVDGNEHVAIHAADGTPLALMDDLDQAIQALADHEMVPVTVH